MDWEDIENMTNKQAAAVLRNYLKSMPIARCNGKSMLFATYLHAMIKAIHALEITPDEEEKHE